MICPICTGNGVIRVTTSAPGETPRNEDRPCVCGAPRRTSGTVNNTRLQGREFRVKVGKSKPHEDPDYNGPTERIDFHKLMGIPRGD